MFKNNMHTQYEILEKKIQLLTYYLDITEKRHKLRMMAGRLKKKENLAQKLFWFYLNHFWLVC